jgi:hypothetical protein
MEDTWYRKNVDAQSAIIRTAQDEGIASAADVRVDGRLTVEFRESDRPGVTQLDESDAAVLSLKEPFLQKVP